LLLTRISNKAKVDVSVVEKIYYIMRP